MQTTHIQSTGTGTGTGTGDAYAVSLWRSVIEGFQITNRQLHQSVGATFLLDPAEAETLLQLVYAPMQRMRMATLAKEAIFSSGGLTKIADRLAARDLVQRVPCVDDRRVTYLELTPAGQQLASELVAHVAEIVRSSYIDALGPERAALVAEAMSDLRDINLASS